MSYLASPETVSSLLLSSGTAHHEEWLPAKIDLVIPLPAKSQQEAESSSLGRKHFIMQSSLGRKQKIVGQSWLKQKLADQFIPFVQGPVILLDLGTWLF